MTKRSPSLRTTLGVVFAAMLLGVYAVVGFAPDWLRGEAEIWLEETTGGPVDFRELRLVVGFPMHLEVGELVALGGNLRAKRISLRFSALSLMRGDPRASRVVVEGAEIVLQTRPETADGSPGGVDGWGFAESATLVTLVASFEKTARELLAEPGFADSIELKHSRVSYVPEGSGSQQPSLSLEGLTGRFQLSRLRGATQLWMAAGLRIGAAPQSRFELAGNRARDGSIVVSLATPGLELGALPALLQPWVAPSELAGQLQGHATFSSPTTGTARVAWDLVATKLVLPVGESGRTLESEHLTIRGHVEADDEGLRLSLAEVRGETLDARLSAGTTRPLNADSVVDLSLKLTDLDLRAIRNLSGWAPESWRDDLHALLGAIEAGRLPALEARARSPLRHWAQLFTGTAWTPPADLQISAELEGLDLALPDAHRVEGVIGSFHWTGDRAHVQLERARFEGVGLPEIELDLAGLSHIFTANGHGRRLHPGAVPVPGAELLWQLLLPEETADVSPPLALELEFLHHPALLWPLEGVEMLLQPTQEASELQILRARWGGTPLRGRLTLPLAGPRRMRLSVEFDARRKGAEDFAAEPGEGVWARGRFELGPMEGPAWQQRNARGAFEMQEGELRLEGVEIGLTPRGELVGHASLDLRNGRALPCEVAFGVTDGDTESLLWLTGLDSRSATGTLEIIGSLQGELTGTLPLLAGLEGELTLRAHDGAIDQSLPPLVALALASQTFDTLRNPDSLRYDRWETTLRFEEGRVSTKAFELDGPDLRLFAAGRIDLLQPPHSLEAEVAVFLFRQLDRALGEIPILNWVLMGRNENLLAAFFELEGPWDKPAARALPLRTLSEGPAGDMILAIPDVMQRGLRALSALLGGDSEPKVEPPATRSGGSVP